MRLFSTLTLAGLSILGCHAMSSMELTKNMKIGWSLGNTLDANCADTLDYSKDQTASETCWGNVKTTEGLFTALMKDGFDTFRIPTTWDGHFGEGPDYKIDSAWMKRVHEVVDYAYKNGAYVILNIHHEKWNYAFANNLEKAKTILVAIWKQIAAEFADYDEHLIFEGLNEPRKVGDPVEWTGGDSEGWDFVNQMNELFVKTIRGCSGENAKRHLMIPTYAATTQDSAINAFKLPSGDNNLIVSLHAYTPYNFALNNADGAVTTFDNPSELDSLFNLIKTKFISQNIPVIIDEFGAMSRENDAERAKWAEYYTKGAKAIGVPCVVWDNGIFEGTGERFGLIDRTTFEIKAPEVVNGLMKGIGSTGPVTPTKKETSGSPQGNEANANVPPMDANANNNNAPADLPPKSLPNELPAEIPTEVPATGNNNDTPSTSLPPKTLPNDNTSTGNDDNNSNTNVPSDLPSKSLPIENNNNNNNESTLPTKTLPSQNATTLPPKTLPNNNNNNNMPAPPTQQDQPVPPTQQDQPVPPTQPEQPVPPTQQNPPAPQAQPEQPSEQQDSPAPSGDYFSCPKDDWNCKQGMADKCYKEADSCWTSQGDASKCEDLIKNCNKIWQS